MPTITELATKALEAPETLTTAEIIRLGAWVVDHEEHVVSHLRATSPRFGTLQPREATGRWVTGAAPLAERLAPLHPVAAEPLVGDAADDETHAEGADA